MTPTESITRAERPEMRLSKLQSDIVAALRAGGSLSYSYGHYFLNEEIGALHSATVEGLKKRGIIRLAHACDYKEFWHDEYELSDKINEDGK